MKLKQKIAIQFIKVKFKLLSLASKRKTAEQAFELFCTPIFKPVTKVPAIFTTAEPLNFLLDGIPIVGYRWNKTKQPAVLILHGFGSAAHNFHQYITSLIEQGFQVLAFDAPAHGASGGKTVNAQLYSEMILQIVSLYGPIQGFLSHSFGGLAVSLAMEKLPHNHQTKIVFIAPATETTTAIDSAFKLLEIEDKSIRKLFNMIIYKKSGHAPAWFSIKRAMKNINASVLWIHDEDDDTTPLSDALLVRDKGFTNIEFMITRGLGHRKIYRDTQVKNKAVAFLCAEAKK